MLTVSSMTAFPAPFRTRSARFASLTTWDAVAPNAMQIAVATALLPEPFRPVMKLIRGPKLMRQCSWHMKSRSSSLLRGHAGDK